MTRNSAAVLSNAALCIVPIMVLPIASVTAIGGPCAGIIDARHGIALFISAVAGMCAVIVGWHRWSLFGPMSTLNKLAKIATCVAGLGVFMLNGFFAFFAGMNLFGMAVSRIHGY